MNGQMWHRGAFFVALCVLVVVLGWVVPVGLPVWVVVVLAAGAYVVIIHGPAELARLLPAAASLYGCPTSVQLAS